MPGMIQNETRMTVSTNGVEILEHEFATTDVRRGIVATNNHQPSAADNNRNSTGKNRIRNIQYMYYILHQLAGRKLGLRRIKQVFLILSSGPRTPIVRMYMG